jgi:3',5'-cyclic-AMP phosphodiesterase
MTTIDALHQWTLIQITDTHLMDQVDAEFVKMNPEFSFRTVMQDVLSQHAHIDALIHTGDLAQVPVQATYDRYLNYMQQTSLQHYQIPGNHDNAAIFPFKEGINQANIFHLGNWSIILLNSAVKGQIDGWIEQEHLQQLDTLLTEYADRHIIVACHHHPFIMHSRWIDQHRLKNTEHLTDVLARHTHVKMVLCGHVHQDSCHEWNGIDFLSTPATSVQFRPRSDQFALDDEAPGYRVLRLFSDGQYQTEVKRVILAQQKINAEISGY